MSKTHSQAAEDELVSFANERQCTRDEAVAIILDEWAKRRKIDQAILELRSDGLGVRTIAARFQLGSAYVEALCSSTKPSKALPAGMSYATAHDVMRVVGYWPSSDTAENIVKDLMVISAGTRKIKTMRELGKWLDSLGLTP